VLREELDVAKEDAAQRLRDADAAAAELAGLQEQLKAQKWLAETEMHQLKQEAWAAATQLSEVQVRSPMLAPFFTPC
jgi:hypothetical protein